MKREVAEAKREKERGKQPMDRHKRGKTSKQRKDLEEENENLHNPSSSQALPAENKRFFSASGGQVNDTLAGPRYGTRSRFFTLPPAQCKLCNTPGTPSKRFPSHCSTLTTSGSIVAAAIPDKFVKGQPPQAQIPENDMLILKSSAAGDKEARNSQPLYPRKGSASNSSTHLNQASNFNYTEIAQMVENESFDEVESAADPSNVIVNGYKVKEEYAFLLKSVLSKYGDIAKNCLQKSTTYRSFQLERLCGIYQNLEKRGFTRITITEIEFMLAELGDLEIVNLETGWLRQRLEDISEALTKSKAYPNLKKKKEQSVKDLEAVEEKIRLAEEERAGLLAKDKKIDDRLSEAKAKMHTFLPSLVAGLL